MLLSPEEIRVLGSLVEKERTTPEYYPLTLNALVTACNQKTNREPVVNYDETTVEIALDGLHRKGFISNVTGAGLRARKFLHLTEKKLGLNEAESAVLCVLMLRGPQTGGEIRGRTGRMHTFDELSDVETVLQGLIDREAGALVARLPKLPGTKEHRHVHLLGGEPDWEELEASASQNAAGPSSSLDELRAEVQSLREELGELKTKFQALLDQLT